MVPVSMDFWVLLDDALYLQSLIEATVSKCHFLVIELLSDPAVPAREAAHLSVQLVVVSSYYNTLWIPLPLFRDTVLDLPHFSHTGLYDDDPY